MLYARFDTVRQGKWKVPRQGHGASGGLFDSRSFLCRHHDVISTAVYLCSRARAQLSNSISAQLGLRGVLQDRGSCDRC